jgi:hypothetical protein
MSADGAFAQLFLLIDGFWEPLGPGLQRLRIARERQPACHPRRP